MQRLPVVARDSFLTALTCSRNDGWMVMQVSAQMGTSFGGESRPEDRTPAVHLSWLGVPRVRRKEQVGYDLFGFLVRCDAIG